MIDDEAVERISRRIERAVGGKPTVIVCRIVTWINDRDVRRRDHWQVSVFAPEGLVVETDATLDAAAGRSISEIILKRQQQQQQAPPAVVAA